MPTCRHRILFLMASSNGREVVGMKWMGSVLFVMGFAGVALVNPGLAAKDSVQAEGVDEYHPLALHRNIRDGSGDCYLVCEYQVEIHPHGIDMLAARGEMELHVKAVVIDVYGDAKLSRGDKIEYIQYWGSAKESAEEAARRTGNLAFIFRCQTPGGMFFDPQDPSSRLNYSKKVEEGLLRFFQAKKKEGG